MGSSLAALSFIEVCLLLLRVSHRVCGDGLTYWGGGAGDSSNSAQLMQLVGLSQSHHKFLPEEGHFSHNNIVNKSTYVFGV